MSDAPYRDDREADQARIAALEAELSAAKDRIAELEGKRSQALVLASSTALTTAGMPSLGTRVAGAPVRLELRRTFDGAFPSDKFEDLIEAIREITGERGRSELMRTSVSWSTSTPERSTGPFLELTVSVRGNVTTLVARDRLHGLAGAIFGGVGGGVGGGAIMAPIGLAIAIGSPVAVPLLLGGWLAGAYAGSRALFKRGARKRAERMQAVFDAVVAEIERALRDATG